MLTPLPQPLYNMVYWRGCEGVYTPCEPSVYTMTYCFDEKELGDIMKSNRRSMKKLALVFSIISISILLASSAQAAWVPIGDFVSISSIPTEGLEVGDKIFSDFDVTAISAGGAFAPGADSVLVRGGQNDETDDFGLQFRLAWVVGSEQIINANIDFKVSIAPDYEPWFMDEAVLFLMNAGATGNGSVSANEIIYDSSFMGNALAALDTSREFGDGGSDLLNQSQLVLSGEPVIMKEIWVETSIIISGGTVGTAQLTEVFMLYSQVPEPATILMLGLGALALLRKRRV